MSALPRFLVDLDGQRIQRDAGGRHTNADDSVLLSHLIKNPGTERIISHIAAVGNGDLTGDFIVDLLRGNLRLFRLIDNGNFPDAPAGQFQGNGAADTAGPARYDGKLCLEFASLIHQVKTLM